MIDQYYSDDDYVSSSDYFNFNDDDDGTDCNLVDMGIRRNTNKVEQHNLIC